MLAIRALINNILNPGESVKWRTLQGSALVLGGEVYAQGLRLAGNLIMTRLLYPEAFGLMLIVNLVNICVDMLSDTGINSAFILKSRGREQEYLNAAWSIQILRGVFITVIILIAAWPISMLYEKPILFGLIAISSINSLIIGFNSPREMMYERDLRRLQIVALDAFVQTISLAFIIACLFFYPTIWFLVAYSALTAILKMSLSHFVFKGLSPKFELQAKVVSEIFHYGKWIFLSTALGFLAIQGSKLITTFWMSTEKLGIFSVAVALAVLPEMLSGILSGRILLPVYAELQHNKNSDFLKQARKVKLGLFSICTPIVLLFALFGSVIIDFLYDSRYYEAGWMLQVMVLGTIFSANNEALFATVLSKADSFSFTMLMGCRVIIVVSTMFLGGYLFDTVGVIYGIAIAPALLYPILGIFVRRYEIYTMKIDYLMTGTILVLVLLSWSYFGWPSPTL